MTELLGHAIYANVGPDGVIVFEPEPDPGLRRLPIGSAPASTAPRFKAVVETLARLHRDGVTRIVPGVPDARSEEAAIDALLRFRKLVEQCMSEGAAC